MTRRQWLVANLGGSLLAKLRQEDVSLSSPQEAVDHFMGADPTRNHRYTQWMITAYLNDGFLFEDLSKAHDTLEIFASCFHRLPIPARAINTYRSLADLWIAVKPFAVVPETTGKQQKRDQREKAYRESMVLADDDDFTVAVPLTVEAAKWWGKGTRWCTAADKDNAFEQYHRSAPLVVIDLHDGDGKKQLHVSMNGCQFMDADDSPVGPDFVERHWGLLEGIIAWAARVNGCGSIMRYLPEKFHSRELHLAAVRQNGMALKYVPLHLRDEELCDAAIECDGYAFPHVPRHFKTEEFIKRLLSKHGYVLNQLPEDQRTAELCDLAVGSWSEALRDVPNHLRTREICLKAVESNRNVLQHVPQVQRDYELCLAAVRGNALSLLHVPQALRTLEMCLGAVASKRKCIDFVPEDLKEEVLRMLPEPETNSGRIARWHWEADEAYVERLKNMIGQAFAPAPDNVLVGGRA